MLLAFRFEAGINIQPVLLQLKQHGIECETRNTEHHQELLIADEAYLSSVNALCCQFLEQNKRTLSINNLKAVPVVLLMLLFTLITALVTGLGDSNQAYFFIANMIYEPRGWQLYEGIWLFWHSISPIFLHFGIEHIVFNGLMFWYLGSILERELGHVSILIIVLLLALCSNYAQLIMSGPLFGGLSGVVYGLMVFAFAYQIFVKPLYLPKGLFYVAMVWLLLGFTPIFSYLGLGNMANTAHVSGALAGLIFFIVYKLFSFVRSV